MGKTVYRTARNGNFKLALSNIGKSQDHSWVFKSPVHVTVKCH